MYIIMSYYRLTIKAISIKLNFFFLIEKFKIFLPHRDVKRIGSCNHCKKKKITWPTTTWLVFFFQQFWLPWYSNGPPQKAIYCLNDTFFVYFIWILSFITNNANIFYSFYILCKRIELFPLSMFIFFLSIKLSLNGVLSLVTVLFINIFSLCIFKNKTNSDWSHMLSIWNCINPCMYLTIKSNRPTLSFNEKKSGK